MLRYVVRCRTFRAVLQPIAKAWSTLYTADGSSVIKAKRERNLVHWRTRDRDQPGQFRAAYSIAVDGYGRVYVGDIKGIQIFDSDGRYLTRLDVKGVAFGMVFNDKNELFVVARDHVVKYAVRAP